MGQLYDEKGKPLGGQIYENIIKDRYIIAKHSHISYSDTGKMTPKEREEICKLVEADLKQQKEALDKIKNKKNKTAV